MYQRGAYDGTKDVVKRASLSPHGKPVVAMTERADEPGVWEARMRIKASEWGDRKYTFAVLYGRESDADPAAWKTHGEGGYDGGESVASTYDAALNDAALRCADSDAGDGVWVGDDTEVRVRELRERVRGRGGVERVGGVRGGELSEQPRVQRVHGVRGIGGGGGVVIVAF
jgi:hypothetical protein